MQTTYLRIILALCLASILVRSAPLPQTQSELQPITPEEKAATERPQNDKLTDPKIAVVPLVSENVEQSIGEVAAGLKSGVGDEENGGVEEPAGEGRVGTTVEGENTQTKAADTLGEDKEAREEAQKPELNEEKQETEAKEGEKVKTEAEKEGKGNEEEEAKPQLKQGDAPNIEKIQEPVPQKHHRKGLDEATKEKKAKLQSKEEEESPESKEVKEEEEGPEESEGQIENQPSEENGLAEAEEGSLERSERSPQSSEGPMQTIEIEIVMQTEQSEEDVTEVEEEVKSPESLEPIEEEEDIEHGDGKVLGLDEIMPSDTGEDQREHDDMVQEKNEDISKE